MAGKEKKTGGETRGAPGREDISYGEAARSAERKSAGDGGLIDSEEAARAESEIEERKPSSMDALATDGERVAKHQGKAGTGDVTDHESESERHGGEPIRGDEG